MCACVCVVGLYWQCGVRVSACKSVDGPISSVQISLCVTLFIIPSSLQLCRTRAGPCCCSRASVYCHETHLSFCLCEGQCHRCSGMHIVGCGAVKLSASFTRLLLHNFSFFSRRSNLQSQFLHQMRVLSCFSNKLLRNRGRWVSSVCACKRL